MGDREYEQGRLFTEPLERGGSRLTNTIYIEGPMAGLWRRILGPAAARTLPDAQRAVVGLAEAG